MNQDHIDQAAQALAFLRKCKDEENQGEIVLADRRTPRLGSGWRIKRLAPAKPTEVELAPRRVHD